MITPEIEQLYMHQHFDLKEVCGKDIYSTSGPDIMTLHRVFENRELVAIRVEVPTHKKYHPAKMVATEYNMFAVFEYRMEKEYWTTEISWPELDRNFKDGLKALCAEPERKSGYVMVKTADGYAAVYSPSIIETDI